MIAPCDQGRSDGSSFRLPCSWVVLAGDHRGAVRG